MSGVWDFSPLLSNFQPRFSSDEVPEKYSSLADEMKAELDKISAQISLLDREGTMITPDDSLLSVPEGILLSPPSKATIFNNSNIQIAIPDHYTPIERAPRVRSKEISGSRNSKLPPLKKTTNSNNSISRVSTKSGEKLTEKSSVKVSGKSSANGSFKNSEIVSQIEGGFQTTDADTKIKKKPIFKATPDVIEIPNFTVSRVYKMKFTIQNVSDHTKSYQVNGPKDPAFSFRILDKSGSSLVRPGLNVPFEVTFAPTEPRDYYDNIVIITEGEPVLVKLNCYRDKPILELPDLVNLGSALVYSTTTGSFTITNHGGIAFFSLKSTTGREASLSYTDGPFTLSPSQFELGHEETVEITVRFRPSKDGNHTASFEVVPEHFEGTQFYFITEAAAVAPQLKFGLCDDDFIFVPFLPSDCGAVREVEIINNSEITFPYHIQIVRPNRAAKSCLGFLYPEFECNENSLVSTQQPFLVSPLSGTLNPHENAFIKIQFNPKKYGFFRSNLVIFADRVPDETGSLGSKKMLVIGVEGNSGSSLIDIRPPLVVFNNVVPGVPSPSQLEIENNSYLKIGLDWPVSNAVRPAETQSLTDNFNEAPQQATTIIDLMCTLNRPLRAMVSTAAAVLFNHHEELTKQFSRAETPKDAVIPRDSGEYGVSYTARDSSFFPTSAETLVDNHEETSEISDESNPDEDEDEMPNIFSPRRDRSIFEDKNKQKSAHVVNDICLNDENADNDDSVGVRFAYAAHIEEPKIEVEPPVVDYKYVMVGEEAHTTITLHNTAGCDVGYELLFSTDSQQTIFSPNDKGIVVKESSITIDLGLKVSEIKPINELVTIKSWWHIDFGSETLDEERVGLPVSETFFKVIGNVDKPLLKFDNRIIDIGYVYPTLTYQAKFHAWLANIFPTNFKVSDFTGTIPFFKPANVQERNRKKAFLESLKISSNEEEDNEVTEKNNDQEINEEEEEEKTENSHEEEDAPNSYIENEKPKEENQGNQNADGKEEDQSGEDIESLDNPPHEAIEPKTQPTHQRHHQLHRAKSNLLSTNKSINVNPDSNSLLNDQNPDFAISTKSSKPIDELETTAKTIQNMERSRTVACNVDEEPDADKIEVERLRVDIVQSTESTPTEGELNPGDSFDLDVSVKFADLGDRSLPVIVDIPGTRYTCAVVAHVIPPKVTLISESIDFSDDFVICHRSFATVKVANECDVASTVRLDIVDDSNGVFKINEKDTKELYPQSGLTFQISCYSEVHGDYHGSIKLIIRDLWQSREILIPLHCKAHRSFFGFQTHTLGYVKSAEVIQGNADIEKHDTDYITFGKLSSGEKALRRLYVENYSSEDIVVEWFLLNLVRGRRYVDISFELDQQGKAVLDITESEEASLMKPFSIHTTQVTVPGHDHALIEIDFLPESPGTYKGIISARCGEFVHELDLVGICE